MTSQISFLWPGAQKLCYFLVMFFSIAGLKNFEIRKSWFKYVFLFLILLALTSILHFFGISGDLKPRPLFASFFSLIVILYIAFNLNENPRLRRLALDVVALSLLLEVAIILLQFSYITYGVGILPRNEDAEITGFITGSYGNANNVAVVLVLELLLLVSKGWITRGAIGYLTVALTGCAVFLTLSRTAFVIYLTVFIYFSVRGKLRSVDKLLGGLIFAILMMAGAQLIGTTGHSDKSDNAVISRSITKLATLGEIQGDSSVQFRVISMTRLGESIGTLGLGTMSDLNYGRFFKDDDIWLAKVNPHALVAEVSFLFGYLGFVLISCFFVFCFLDLYALSGNLIFSAYVLSIFLLFQAVPSSVLGVSMFFLVIILTSKMDPISEA